MKWLDRQIGKHLYVPLVIFVCQRTSLTQYALYRYLWMIVGWLFITRISNRPVLVGSIYVFLALVLTLSAGWQPDREAPPSSTFFRMSWLALEMLHITGHVLGWERASEWNATCPAGQMILFAEYALTVRTIPPREVKPRETALNARQSA